MPTALPTGSEGRWVPTSTATQCLGVSSDSLRRYARSGVLRAGEHYRPGLLANSPWVWRLDTCAQELLKLGNQREQSLQQEEKKPSA